MFGDQLAWLEADLQKANANTDIDWIIAFGWVGTCEPVDISWLTYCGRHRPWYVSSYDFTVLGQPDNGYQYVQQAFEPLFHRMIP